MPYQNYSQVQLERKNTNENTRPEQGVPNQHGNNEYQKLHDKLNYLENKITEMKSNLDKKREEKKKYFEK